MAGYRKRHHKRCTEIRPGDLLICYLRQLSRWSGVLEVQDKFFWNENRKLYGMEEFLPLCFKVKSLVTLEMEAAVPIKEEEVWNRLSITRKYQLGQSGWAGFFLNSLNRFDESDGRYLVDLLREQQANPKSYPFTEKDRRRIAQEKKIRTHDREVEVEIPEPDEDDVVIQGPVADPVPEKEILESIRMQAKVARIGAEMGFRIWVPRNDRARVLALIPADKHGTFLEELPLNYGDLTLRTIEQIDVIWLKGRSMARAFEIEHSTAVYSGLLRMADLLALQPNMNIRLHIVAPDDRREKVLREIKRPTFSLLERGPLYEQCSFLSYDSVNELNDNPKLAHINDSILAEYEEFTEV